MINFKSTKALVMDFDGVLTNNKVFVTGIEGQEFVICDRSDSLGLSMIKEAGIRAHILSKEKNKIVEYRAQKLNVTCDSGIDNKLEILKTRAKEWGVEMSDITYIGNDRNDLECLKAVGISVVPSDAFEAIKNEVNYITKRGGGDGCVREVCELILGIK